MGILFVIVPFLLGALLCALFLPIGVDIARRRHLFDEINERKSHTVATPRIGGIIFVPVLILALSLSAGFLIPGLQSSLSEVKYGFLRHLCFFCSGLMIIYLTGWIDDFRGVKYKWKFISQICAAVMIILGGYYFYSLGGVFGLSRIPKWAAYPFTVLVVVALINAYNLVDGIDGLCSALGIITLSFLGWCFIRNGMVFQTILSASTIGVFFVFFICNVFLPKHKTFMGDTGSMVMGYVIAYLAVSLFCGNYYHSHIFSYRPLQLGSPLAVIIGAVFHPAFDMCRVFVTRIVKGTPVFVADRIHFHHKLLDIGFSHRRATLVIALVQVLFIALNWALSSVNLNINLIIVTDLAVAGALWQLMNLLRRRAGV